MPAPSLARLRWRALGAVIVLTLGVMCTVMAFAMSTAPVTGSTVMGEAMAATAPGTPVAVSVAGKTAAESPVMGSMCSSPCVGAATSVACTAAAGLIVTTALMLLVASRRNTYLGLLARDRGAGLTPRRLPDRTPWLLLSPVSLCVLRV